MAYNLYILMRTDMASMNAGKGMAQAAHAANDAIGSVSNYVNHLLMKATTITTNDADNIIFNPIVEGLKEWENSTEAETFGTTYAIDGINEDNIRDITDQFELPEAGSFSGVVVDPTYPIRDGLVTHYISIVTCGWVFCDESVWKANKDAQSLNLHP